MSDQTCCTYSLITYPLPAPLGLAATPDDDSIALTWTAVEDATSYQVTWSPANADGLTTATVTGTTYTITGLSPATQYTIAVVAVPAAGGQDVPSAPALITSTTTAPALAAPTNLTSPAQTTTTIGLSWTASPNATSYGIERSAAGAGVWTEIATATGTTYTATGLTVDTDYDFRISARAAGYTDSPWSSILTQGTAAA
jgi:chitodextrinase